MSEEFEVEEFVGVRSFEVILSCVMYGRKDEKSAMYALIDASEEIPAQMSVQQYDPDRNIFAGWGPQPGSMEFRLTCKLQADNAAHAERLIADSMDVLPADVRIVSSEQVW